MSTSVQIIGVDVSPEAIRDAEAIGRSLYETWDRAFNRFRPESEVSRLNECGGWAMATSQLFREVLEAALHAARQTGNRFNPAILTALEDAGYDRDIDEVRQSSSHRSHAATATAVSPPESIEIDHAAGTVRVPDGTRIDLGGIAKGMFVDRLADALDEWPGGCVDAGGDIRVWGVPPTGDHWIVGVEDPGRQEIDCASLEVIWPEAGIATSGTNRRRWRINGRDSHHIIDPATGRPLTGPIRSATAIAGTAAEAEVASTALLVAAARGEPVETWGSVQAILATHSSTSGLSIARAITHRQPATEGRHGPPCTIHAFDPAVLTT
jgi:thiamine biosynthesis lipoprotein